MEALDVKVFKRASVGRLLRIMEIIRIVPDFLPTDKAFGHFVTFLQISLKQKEQGHEVIVFCKGMQDKMEYIEGFKVYRLKATHFFPFLSSQLRLMKITEDNFINTSYEIILHSHDRSGLFLSCVKNKPPHVVQLHGLPLPLFAKYRKQNPLSIRGYLYNQRVHYLYKLFLKNADALITYSKDLSLLLKNYGIPDNKIHVVPNGISETFLTQVDQNEKEKILQRLGLSPDNKIILFLGRLKWIKGIYHILYAMPQIIKMHPSVKLLIVGNGDITDVVKIKRLVMALKINDNVILVPHVPHNLTPLYYSVANIHVAIQFAPGYPKTMLESLVCGTPVIALRNYDTEDIILKNNCGVVVEKGTPTEITLKVDYLLSNQKATHNMGANGVRVVREKYTWIETARNLAEIYASLL